MPARSLWQGSISFGLVNIPVKLYTATNSREYVFNQLCQNGHRIRYKKWCPEEEREVPYSEIKKGYEIQKDNYIVFEKEELNKVKLKTTHYGMVGNMRFSMGSRHIPEEIAWRVSR
jgi:DNA end-binding protein Ku